MKENQNIEYKTSWRDEYLKRICGYANADGGVLFTGKNDNGKYVDQCVGIVTRPKRRTAWPKN